jgi:hypothetical protein
MHTPDGPADRGGSSLQPMYAGSKRMSQNGFKSTRRDVTAPKWGCRPVVQGRKASRVVPRAGLRSDSIPLNSTNWVVVAHK